MRKMQFSNSTDQSGIRTLAINWVIILIYQFHHSCQEQGNTTPELSLGGGSSLRTDIGQPFGKHCIKYSQKQEKLFKNWQIMWFCKWEFILPGFHSNGKWWEQTKGDNFYDDLPALTVKTQKIWSTWKNPKTTQSNQLTGCCFSKIWHIQVFEKGFPTTYTRKD